MLLFGRLKYDPVKELIDYVMKEGRVNDFSESSSSISDSVIIKFLYIYLFFRVKFKKQIIFKRIKML